MTAYRAPFPNCTEDAMASPSKDPEANLSFSLRGLNVFCDASHSVFLFHAMPRGSIAKVSFLALTGSTVSSRT